MDVAFADAFFNASPLSKARNVIKDDKNDPGKLAVMQCDHFGAPATWPHVLA
jgi:hypothetical protein